MALRQIRLFVAIAGTGSLTPAARVPNLSQPALGAQLIDRHSRGVVLTGAGGAFLREARSVPGGVARARSAVEAFVGRNDVRASLGITPTSGKTLVLRRGLPATVVPGLLAPVRPIVRHEIEEGGLGWRAPDDGAAAPDAA